MGFVVAHRVQEEISFVFLSYKKRDRGDRCFFYLIMICTYCFISTVVHFSCDIFQNAAFFSHFGWYHCIHLRASCQCFFLILVLWYYKSEVEVFFLSAGLYCFKAYPSLTSYSRQILPLGSWMMKSIGLPDPSTLWRHKSNSVLPYSDITEIGFGRKHLIYPLFNHIDALTVTPTATV